MHLQTPAVIPVERMHARLGAAQPSSVPDIAQRIPRLFWTRSQLPDGICMSPALFLSSPLPLSLSFRVCARVCLWWGTGEGGGMKGRRNTSTPESCHAQPSTRSHPALVCFTQPALTRSLSLLSHHTLPRSHSLHSPPRSCAHVNPHARSALRAPIHARAHSRRSAPCSLHVTRALRSLHSALLAMPHSALAVLPTHATLSTLSAHSLYSHSAP
eukprot:432413-Rhodomonas_salina.1